MAIDTAGNKATTSKTITIDQDADRPVIKFSNLNLSGMTSSAYIWNKQEIIYGTVSDDDGINELRISVDNGNSWTDNIYKDGAWEYTFSSEGKDVLMFKVTDGAGTVFTSAVGSAMAKSPKLIDSQATPNKFGYKVGNSYPNNSDTKVYLTVDTQNPTFKTVYYNTSFDNSMELEYPVSDANWKTDSTINTAVFGGPNSKLYLYITSIDANGIADISVTYDGSTSGVTLEKTQEVTIDDGVTEIAGKISVISVDTSNENNWKKIEVTTLDKSGREGKLNFSVQQDNNAPIIKFTSHSQKAQVYGSSVVTVRGNADDVKDLYLTVTASAAVPSVANLATWQKFDEYTSGSAWAIVFDGEFPMNTAGSTEYKSKSLNKYYDDLFEPNSDNKNADSKTIYVWIYGIDALGNKGTPLSLELSVNPAGDKPTIEFSYPENDNIVGGTVRLAGSSKVSDATASVESVWLQIDPSFNGTFDASWETELSALIKDGSGNYITDYQIVNAAGNVGRGIKASGSATSWNLPINTVGEFNNQNGTNRKIAIRAYAVSSSGKTSEPTEVVFEIDPKAPVIGSTTELELVQYANGASSGTIVRRQKYQADMWISGQWYLIGSIEDDSGIKEVKLNGTSIINDSSKLIRDDNNLPTSATSHRNYQMNIPVGETSGFGTKTYIIWAQEGSDENKDTGNVEIRLNYDNTAPDFVAEGLSATGNIVQQSNGTYTVNGTLSEPSGASGNQSGFGRIAMFFTRTIGDTEYVIDPMISNGNDGKQNRYASSGFAQANGMYWRNYNVYSVEGNQITLSTTPHANVRIGGLCKVDNVDYLIEDIDGNVVTISGNITTSVESVSFAVAQIINNMTIESGTTQAYDSSSLSPVTRDDGDQMVEGVSKSGTTFSWTASINSSLIYDGPIDIHFVAFDAAGNAVATKYSGSVVNNQPRIAGVKFGTDENGNGVVADDELQTAWSGLYANEGGSIPAGYKTATEKVTSLSIPTDLKTSVLKIKGLTVVKPEIVGGNTGLGYTYKVDSYTSNVVGLSDVHSDNDEIRTGLSDITITVEDLLRNKIADGEKTFTFNIWDKTEGLTYGTNSQKAEINIKMNVAIRDSEAPKAGFKQFYWNSETDNSLYQNSRENGHIELEGDLSDDVVKKYGNDPKVSGKITFRGIATDNGVLNKIQMQIPGLTGYTSFADVATRNANGTWTCVNALGTTGLAFEIKSETFSQETGNIVEFEVHWDTEKLSTVAANNVAVKVQAFDKGTASWNGSSVVYTTTGASSVAPTDAPNATYTMDVVPYITGLDTTLTGLEKKNPSVYGRSALGKYPVYYYRKTTEGSPKSETITLKGFNIKSGSTVTFAGGATATLNNDMSFTLHENAKSGEIKVTVGEIESLNNINNDEAKVDNTASDNESKYANAYNRQPNGQNNDLLTDNVEIAIWEINSKAAIAENGELSEVVMHVNPSNGMLGFAFAHSQDLASYPNGNTNSYETWMTDYTGVNQIGFIYDQNGNMFGTNGGTDTYTASKKTGRLGLISSHWGPITDHNISLDKYTGYTKYRRLRLEYLGVTKNGSYVSNVNRFAKGDSIQFATTTSADTGTNLYMMYYDNTLGELKFKAGNFGNAPENPCNNPDDELWKPSAVKFGDFADDAYNQQCNLNADNYNPNYNTISIVANQSGANGNATVRPGIYYSISVVPATKSGTGSDVVVAVWYDDTTNKTLWYSYLVNPLDKAGNRDEDGDISTDEWATPIPILDGHAGGYCAIKADDDGHIHIAAYSRNDAGSLYYAYLDKYNSTFDKSTNLVAVDSYGSQGQYITMEVAKDTAGNNIPYIGYYMNSLSYPKYAYLANPGATVAGVDENNMYTGNWETIMLPTTSTLVLDDINIGVYKNSDGKLQAIPTRTDEKPEVKKGIAGGNGTSNPIFGYGIAETGSGYIETAQLK